MREMSDSILIPPNNGVGNVTLHLPVRVGGVTDLLRIYTLHAKDENTWGGGVMVSTETHKHSYFSVWDPGRTTETLTSLPLEDLPITTVVF